MNYNKESGSLEFEGNPLVTRPFTLGKTVNYSGADKGDGGPDYNDKYSYTGSMSTPTGYPTTRMHENGHVEQYNKWGVLFGPAYIVNGVYTGVKYEGTLNPNNDRNWFEVDADTQAKQTKMNEK